MNWQMKAIAAGGDPWSHGDWLINNGAGLIRRGWSGEVFIWISEILNAPLLSVLVIFQILIVTSVLGALVLRGIFLGANDLVTLAILSPGVMFFTINDPAAIFRKEILLYLAFVPLMFPGRFPAFLAAVLFCAAAFFHEALAFFCGPLALAVWLNTRRAAPVIMILVAAAAAVGFALAFPVTENTDAICGPLTDRGLSQNLCSGIIGWLSADLSANLSVVATNALQAPLVSGAFGAAICLAAPVLAALHVFRERGSRIMIALSFVTVMPLFIVGYDWGRWLSVMVTCLMFMILANSSSKKITGLPPMSLWSFILLLEINLFLGMRHIQTIPTKGFLPRLLDLTFG